MVDFLYLLFNFSHLRNRLSHGLKIGSDLLNFKFLNSHPFTFVQKCSRVFCFSFHSHFHLSHFSPSHALFSNAFCSLSFLFVVFISYHFHSRQFLKPLLVCSSSIRISLNTISPMLVSFLGVAIYASWSWKKALKELRGLCSWPRLLRTIDDWTYVANFSMKKSISRVSN